MRVPMATGVFALLLGYSLRAQSNGLARTPEGHPDLQGIWNVMTKTPLERPLEFARKATVTDAEARAYEKADHSEDLDPEASPEEVAANKEDKAIGGRASQFWEDPTQLARVNGRKRTSLVVDPPDGKLPARTREGAKRGADVLDRLNRYDSVKDRQLTERCLPDSEIPIIPVGLNDNYQIVQTPDYVMILAEMVHDVRIVRMNAPHLPSSIRLWLGDSVGHWERDTLVVDTTNFNDQPAAAGTSQDLHVVERFSRIDANTLLYRATVEDPGAFKRPWTIVYPFAASSKPIYEYACHEGNESLRAILHGERIVADHNLAERR
jgi:hypothetical protein